MDGPADALSATQEEANNGEILLTVMSSNQANVPGDEVNVDGEDVEEQEPVAGSFTINSTACSSQATPAVVSTTIPETTPVVTVAPLSLVLCTKPAAFSSNS